MRAIAVLAPFALAALLAGCAHETAGSKAPGAESEPAPRTPPPEPSRTPPPTPTTIVAPTPGAARRDSAAGRPTDGELPKFGDYVYVEELPEAIERPAPVYPEAARRAGIDGFVMVQALVRTDGSVAETRIVKSIPALDDAAAACVMRWRFKPAMSHGNPVAVWVGVPVKFSLK